MELGTDRLLLRRLVFQFRCRRDEFVSNCIGIAEGKSDAIVLLHARAVMRFQDAIVEKHTTNYPISFRGVLP